jgi:hypothetical protein
MQMRNVAALVVLSTLIPPPSAAAEEGSEYQSWCSRRADSERIAAEDKADYVKGCIDELVQADRNPGLSPAKKQAREDEG